MSMRRKNLIYGTLWFVMTKESRYSHYNTTQKGRQVRLGVGGGGLLPWSPLARS